MKISRCMIVRNEEDRIEQAINYTREWYDIDEIIIIDTGSTDNTVALIEEAQKSDSKIKLFQEPWQDDFAFHKNSAIEKVDPAADWILFTDADEYLVEDDVIKVRDWMQKMETSEELKKYECIRMPWKCIDANGKVFCTQIQDRLFKNKPSIRYHGIIHEQIEQEGGIAIIQLNDVAIIHTGSALSPEAQKKKFIRNTTLLEKALEKDPDNLRLKCLYADSLKMDPDGFDEDKVYEIFKEVAAGLDPTNWQCKDMALCYLCYYTLNRDKFEECEKYIEEAIKNNNESPDYPYLKGLLNLKKNDYQAALDSFVDAHIKWVTNTSALSWVFVSQFDQLVIRLMLCGVYLPLYNWIILKMIETYFDFSSLKDLMYLAKTSIDYGNLRLASIFTALLPDRTLIDANQTEAAKKEERPVERPKVVSTTEG